MLPPHPPAGQSRTAGTGRNDRYRTDAAPITVVDIGPRLALCSLRPLIHVGADTHQRDSAQIWLTLGDDGRLLALFIADSVPRTMTHLELEAALNELIRAGNEAIANLLYAGVTDSEIDAHDMAPQ
ncbi:MAG: hypothetical protein JOZ49_05725 [Mycolicibacterium sp.]|nr:hypothetical protein [Mycolicibacterium sp.]